MFIYNHKKVIPGNLIKILIVTLEHVTSFTPQQRGSCNAIISLIFNGIPR